MINSLIGSIMNMTADIEIQQIATSSRSGNIERQWVYSFTTPCKIEPMRAGGALNRADNKTFGSTGQDEYTERLQLKMKSPVQLSRRWRVTNIRGTDGKSVFIEIDRIDQPDTIFEVTASHAEVDPLGKVSYYETTLARVMAQVDDTTPR